VNKFSDIRSVGYWVKVLGTWLTGRVVMEPTLMVLGNSNLVRSLFSF